MKKSKKFFVKSATTWFLKMTLFYSARSIGSAKKSATNVLVMVKSVKPLKAWNEVETDLFKKLWTNPKVTREMLLKVFIDRTWDALTQRAINLKLGSFGQIRQAKVDLEYLESIQELIKI